MCEFYRHRSVFFARLCDGESIFVDNFFSPPKFYAPSSIKSQKNLVLWLGQILFLRVVWSVCTKKLKSLKIVYWL